MARLPRGLVATWILALFVLCPIVWAATAESWTDGVWDSECDELAPMMRSADAAVVGTPVLPADPGPAVVGAVAPLVDLAVDASIPPAYATRAPPLS